MRALRAAVAKVPGGGATAGRGRGRGQQEVATATGLDRRARVVHRAAAHALDYPDAARHERVPLVRAALERVGGAPAAAVARFLEHTGSLAPGEAEAHYVDVFDFNTRHSPYLTWWLDGDTRRRGASLVELKQAYRAAGLEPGEQELPDFLPVVLEFTSTVGDAGVLLAHRPGPELLRIALAEDGTAYAGVVEAVCATLPGPSPKDRAEARALAAAGPQSESVGLGAGPDALVPRPYGHLDLLPVVSPDPEREVRL